MNHKRYPGSLTHVQWEQPLSFFPILENQAVSTSTRPLTPPFFHKTKEGVYN